MMQTVKKGISIVLMFILCMNFIPAGAAEEIRIPATAQEALERLPIEVPPIPQITVDDSNPEERVLYIEGLEAWPLKDGSKYQSGAFTYSYYAEKGPYVPIQGREDEPLSIAIPQKWQGSNLFFNLEEEGWVYIRNNATVVEVALSFEDVSCDFAPDGTLRQYSLQVSDGPRVTADYSADGLLCAYFYDYYEEEEIPRIFSYDALGEIIDTFGLKKDGVDYCCIAGQWYYWNECGYTPCEKPEGIDLPSPAVLEGEEGIAQIEAKREAYLASMPTLPPEDGMVPRSFDIKSQFPAAPVLTQEELDDGSLRYVLTGLEPWGIEMRYDYRYGGSALFDQCNSTVPGQLSLTIPAELISDWNEYSFWLLSSDVISTNVSNGKYLCVRYEDWWDTWVFTVYVSPDAGYDIVLGPSPYVASCWYILDGKKHSASYYSDGSLSYEEISSNFLLDGAEVRCLYTSQGEVDSYELFPFLDGVSLSAEYDADGQLTVLYYYGNDLDCYFWAATNEWHDYASDGDDPCEPPEGFDLSPWMTLDVSRLEPRLL